MDVRNQENCNFHFLRDCNFINLMENLNYLIHIGISDIIQISVCYKDYRGAKIPEMLVAANPDLGATKGVELASISPSFTFIHFHGEVQCPPRQQEPQNSFSTKFNVDKMV